MMYFLENGSCLHVCVGIWFEGGLSDDKFALFFVDEEFVVVFICVDLC